MESINIKDPVTLLGIAGVSGAIGNMIYTNNQVTILLERILELEKKLTATEAQIGLLRSGQTASNKKIEKFEKEEKKKEKVIQHIMDKIPKDEKRSMSKLFNKKSKKADSDSENEEDGVV